MAEILFVDADFDKVTEYCCVFRTAFIIRHIPPYLYDHLRERRATQPNVDNHINNARYRYVSGAGHGLYRMFLGFRDSEIWNASDDLTHLSGSIVHLLSCQAGASLGRSMVKQGVRAFWGYAEDFVFVKLKNPPPDILQDENAEFVLTMDFVIDNGILNNESADIIYDKVDNYVATMVSRVKPHVRDALISNYQNLVCPMTTYGDPNATI